MITDEAERAVIRQLHENVSIYNRSGVFEEFEDRFAQLHDKKYALLNNSGTNSILAMFIGADLRPGDEVLCPAYTFFATNACIEEGIVIPSQAAISALMSGTTVADALRRDEPIYFLDDLFYRGRTLYSLAILMTACGGDPMNMRLTTLSSDIKSTGLESPQPKRVYTLSELPT